MRRSVGPVPMPVVQGSPTVPPVAVPPVAQRAMKAGWCEAAQREVAWVPMPSARYGVAPGAEEVPEGLPAARARKSTCFIATLTTRASRDAPS